MASGFVLPVSQEKLSSSTVKKSSLYAIEKLPKVFGFHNTATIMFKISEKSTNIQRAQDV